MLRTTFVIEALRDARMYATAHGIYETFMNGCRVGDRELTPGFTAYWANLHVQVYDVGALLRAGENEWRVVLSDGWYRGRLGNWQASENYGDALAFLGQLQPWQLRRHERRGLVLGSRTHPCRRPHGRPGRGPSDRADGLGPRRGGGTRLRPSRVLARAADRAVEHLRARSVRRLTRERQVADLGQNINGWVRLSDLGPRDTELTLVHGEVVDGVGDVTLSNLANDELCVAQTDRVISAGLAHDTFEPRHTTHGFRYVQIDGHPHRLTPDDVVGVVVQSDLRRTGWFRCSDERINRFHEIADWSFRGNVCEIPTDCPTRERAGWTGDWQAFLPSAAFLYDVAGFSRKWLRDLALEQLSDGCILNIAPDPTRARGRSGPDDYWRYLQGSSGWGDAIVMVPWELYRVYGDRDLLAEFWPAMVRWVDYAATRANPPLPRPVQKRDRTQRRMRSTCGMEGSTGASGWSQVPSTNRSGQLTKGTSGRPSSTTAPAIARSYRPSPRAG